MSEAPAAPIGSRVWTVAPGRPFIEAFAAGLLARFPDPAVLASATVLMPTRRAGRALAEALVARLPAGAALLPRMLPLGDLDETALGFEPEPASGAALDLPPAMPPLRRQLLLARLIAASDAGMPADRATRLAGELARLLDSVQFNRLGFEKLADLAPEEFSAHWGRTLQFLRIVTEVWPQILADEGAIDPVARGNALAAAQIAAWRAAPPEAPVIAAGSTGAMPAGADLIAEVATLPQGMVVLPGLDRALDEASWAALGATHPQHALKGLLERLGVERAAVAPWEDPDVPPPRARLVAEMMRPAETTGAWRLLDLPPGAFDGITRIDCANPEEEARVAALLLREAIERPGMTAALVTPDRALAQRVAAALARWDLVIDDSAGRALGETPPGTFLRLAAAAFEAGLAPVPLLALLGHPLAAGGRTPAAFRAEARLLDLTVLRGPRPAAGTEGLLAAARGTPSAGFVEAFAAAAAPLEAALERGAGLAALIEQLVVFAEALAATDTERGADRVWAGDAGEAAARFISDLMDSGDRLGLVRGRDFAGVLDALMQAVVVRPNRGAHPRLAIWGPLEARLQRADRVILAGLNEGTWPAAPPADPWMSRPMRAAFGLPPPEQRIGLSAHDFAQALGAPEVFLTRAERVEGVPTIPSRWLLRLDAVCRAIDAPADGCTRGSASWRAWSDVLAAADVEARPAPPPRPAPPVAMRPRKLSVTQIETWQRDPYAIYARHVLGLAPLDPVDADPGAAERGTILHAALGRFIARHPVTLPDDAEAVLVALGRDCFGALLERPGVRAFWWPRFVRMAHWFVAAERARRVHLASSHAEVRGVLDIAAPGGPFLLTGSADRLDRLRAGGWAVIDYKTGAPPSASSVRSGHSPQLALEAAMVAAGGFKDLPAGAAAALEYWQLGGANPPGRAISVAEGAMAAQLGEAARDGLARLVAAFDDPAQPFLSAPRPGQQPRFSDYAHLARTAEWGEAAE